ncbi:MAG: alpha/beta fold hydrolase [Bdellovibrionota bacterium]|nr:MAG: alpha/beta fold hydrolase [Bdellovibrionota bacterium]
MLHGPTRTLALLVLLLMPAGCTSVFFHPLRKHVQTPQDLGLAYEDVYLSEGPRIHGWYLPAQGTHRATILFLHGNAENISTHINSVAWLPQVGFAVFALDYRGFGRSEGSPTLAALSEDVEIATEYLKEREGSKNLCLFLYGESLGGSIGLHAAAKMAPQRPYCAVISQSAFAGYRRVAGEKLDQFWLTRLLRTPLLWTIDRGYDPLDVVEQIAPTPTLFIHGTADQIVPPDHSRALFERARSPKALWEIEGAGHIQALRSESSRQRFVEYLLAHRLSGSHP